MTTPQKPRREQASTYFVQDRSSEDEMKRLRIQDQALTISMEGVLSEQPNPERFQSILDVGCGSGSWMIETAKTYPGTKLIGIDISGRMLEYAQTLAVEQGVADRIEFRVMDALRMLEFPDNSFDLVNMRMGVSWMRTWDWPKMLSELQRVTRHKGTVRITEPYILHPTNSPALAQYFDQILCAFFKSGHLFTQESTGLTAHLERLLIQHGLLQIQKKHYSSEYRAGTPQGQAYYENLMHSMKTVRPFLQKWGCISDDYDTNYEQAQIEMQQSDFYAIWNLLTVWGTTLK